MLDTVTTDQPRIGRHKAVRSNLAADSATETDSRAAIDLIQALQNGKVLDRLWEILQFTNASTAHDRAIRLPEVLHIMGISKSSWYDRTNLKSPAHDPAAPKHFKLGKSDRSPSVWWHSEIIAYLESLAAASRPY
ncbi:AlpA family phage regulatory protein [Xanthomonas sp. CFBP 8703]|uniref:AlpA family phage regulatory protein n=1 Tax=Xanthomonas bonasiae TaxID=2810351 RepID=A0ABS3B8L8_9XANT|nr:AlpA family phage regulatory protein [Xanthomonas bonasiae]MBN6104907.1 AlpA family phage regulatory protein [Xanthomonas bonasiae]